MLLLLATAFAAEAKQKGEKGVELRIGTYNVWSHSAREWQISRGRATADRSWNHSKEAVAKLLVKLNCDIVGLQEVTSICRNDLQALLKRGGGKKYQLWWKNTYPEGSRSKVGNAVLYNKRLFKFSNEQIYYFSPTPTEMSKGWDEKRHYRAALTATVTHRKSGRKFFFVATHGPLKKVANGHAGRILVEIDKAYNTENLPTIVVGDMNARPGETFHQHMCAHYEDCFLVAKKRCEIIGTFNASSGNMQNFTKPSRRIDHIYVHSTDKGKIEVEQYDVNIDKYKIAGKDLFPSDHNPVVVDLKLK